jgi:ATP-dependent DNA ligase
MAKTLYKVSATGATQVWIISGSLEREEITIQYGQHHGSLQVQKDKVYVNKSGRGLKEQIILEMQSRITKQRAKGYRDTVHDATQHKNENALNLAKPMLAQRYDKVAKFNVTDCHRQHKLDGHRMLVHNRGGDLIAYTRNGKVIDTLDHIISCIDIPEGYTLDGEVYYHGVPLQTIASWCKRKQPDTLKLEYVVYDTIMDKPYGERLDFLRALEWEHPIRLIDTWISDDPITEDLFRSIEDGYEGLILRSTSLGYGSGKRCRSLVKVKEVLDDEFLVLDVVPSRDGWGVLVCRTAEGKEFSVSAPGTMEDKTSVLRSKYLYIGKMIRVEYFSLTKEGKPFHPVATYFREKLSE